MASPVSPIPRVRNCESSDDAIGAGDPPPLVRRRSRHALSAALLFTGLTPAAAAGARPRSGRGRAGRTGPDRGARGDGRPRGDGAPRGDRSAEAEQPPHRPPRTPRHLATTRLPRTTPRPRTTRPPRTRRHEHRAEQGAAALEADVGVLSVPAPTATSSVITVKVGSDRTGITGVTNLAGVVLLLNNGVNTRTVRVRTVSRAPPTAGRSAPPTPRATARSPFRRPRAAA